MAASAAFRMSAGPLNFDHETGMAKAPFELFVLAGGPDSEHAVGLQRSKGVRDSRIVVERGIVRNSERGWAVVHIEQDRVELHGVRS